jgi:hypothetical protein
MRPVATDLEAYRRNLRTIAGTAAAQGFRLAFVTRPSTWNSQVDPRVEDWQWMLFRGGVTYGPTAWMRRWRRSTM